MDKQITSEKVDALEKEILALLVTLRSAQELDETTFVFFHQVRRANRLAEEVHTALAGWEELFGRIIMIASWRET